MRPFLPRANETPRRIEIERCKRLYADQSIQSLIEQEGIRVLSANQVQIKSGTATLSLEPFLPLALFDDDTYEERDVQEWLKAGSLLHMADLANELALAIPAQAYISELNVWLDGFVVSFDEDESLWQFKVEMPKPLVPLDQLKKDYWIPR